MSDINNRCAPHRKYEDGSCFSLESLKLIAKKYNDISSSKIKISNDKNQLVKDLTEIFKNKCSNNQVCWLRQDLVKEVRDEEENNRRIASTNSTIGNPIKPRSTSILHMDIDENQSFNNIGSLSQIHYDSISKVNGDENTYLEW